MHISPELIAIVAVAIFVVWAVAAYNGLIAMRTRVLRHPGVAGLTMGRVPFGPSMMIGAERMLGELRAAGLPDQVAAFVGDLGSLYVGATAYEQEVSPVTDPAAFVAQAASWLKSLPRDQFPNTVELADLLVAGTADDRFEWGLDVLIRGLASYLTSPPTADAGWPPTS